MPRLPAPMFDETMVMRWHALTEKRFAYLVGLYESGRWTRYFSEQKFLIEIRETRIALDRWRQLASPELVSVAAGQEAQVAPAPDDMVRHEARPDVSGSTTPRSDDALAALLMQAVANAVETLPADADGARAEPSAFAPLPPNPFLAHGVTAQDELSVA